MRPRSTTRTIAPERPRLVRTRRAKGKAPRRGADQSAPDALKTGPPPMPDLTLQPQVAQPDRDAHEQRRASE